MKNALLAICLLLSLIGLVTGQENTSPYERMMSLSKEGITDQSLRTFVASLSKEEFRRLIIEYRRENIPSPKVNVFGGMSMLSIPYYEDGAGKDDGVEEWAQDVRDHSLPAEWRDVILGHPPFKVSTLAPAELAVFSNTVTAIAFSEAVPPMLRREALLGLQHAMPLRDYVDMLKESASSEAEDPRFRREALLHMGRIVYRGRLKSEQSPEFNRVANEYDSLLTDLGSRTNLPPVLDDSVKSLKRQKKPREAKGDTGSH